MPLKANGIIGKINLLSMHLIKINIIRRLAVVYAHYRKTDNEIFYIGIGKTEKRAYSKFGRNKYWHNVVNKHDYVIEILCTDLTWEQACDAEIFLIKFYGRRDFKNGPLINMTDGGEGMLGYIPTKESIEKRVANTDYSKVHTKESHLKRVKNTDFRKPERISKCKENYERSKDKLISPESKAKAIKNRVKNTNYTHPDRLRRIRESKDFDEITEKIKFKTKKNVFQYNLKGEFIKEWPSIIEASQSLFITPQSISRCCNGRRPTAHGSIWRLKDPKKWFHPLEKAPFKNKRNTAKIIQMDKDGVEINEWNSVKHIHDTLGISLTAIYDCLHNRKSFSVGFKWQYKVS